MKSELPSDVCLTRLGLASGATLYRNALQQNSAIENWSLEGPGVSTFPQGRLRLESTGAVEEGQKSNLVLWCPEVFPDHVRISWEFYPIAEPGLAILFFAARGRNGEHILDPALAKREGPYSQYHSGDINALHVSYFRRRLPQEIRFHTSNLRKSQGFHLVCQGADPIPGVNQADPPYHIAVIKNGADVHFCVDELLLWSWRDDGTSTGPILEGGSIGFRQMNPFIGEYANLVVEGISAT